MGKSGHTISKHGFQEMESNLWKMSKYQATIEVTIQSNKNTNTYTCKQEYEKQGEKEVATQEILQPENLKGFQIIRRGEQLEVRNTTFNLSKIYEKYDEMLKNDLWLDDFLADYQESPNKEKLEEENAIVFQIQKEDRPYQIKKKLYVSKETGKPQKLVIEDKNQKNRVYILYKEIEIKTEEK